MTHAFFKALLFLGAGSVIIGMHHDQDMRNMGGLRKYMPITWITSLLGSLALIGTPFFSGFYSKDSIIEAVGASHLWGSGFAYFAVVAGVFITAFYSFRMYFLVFHGKERFGQAHGEASHRHDDHAHAHDAHDQAKAAHGHDAHAEHDSDAHHEEEDHGHHGLAPGQKPHESPLVVTLPLILLAIPSVIIGFFAIQPMLFGDFFKNVIYINAERHPAMEELAHEFHSAAAMGVHAFTSLPFILALAGVVAAFYCYMINPRVPAAFYKALRPIHTLLDNKYYMDKFNEVVFAGGARLLGKGLWQVGDRALIDGLVVNGSAKVVGWFSTIVRTFQTGYIYHYAFVMILGVLVNFDLSSLPEPVRLAADRFRHPCAGRRSRQPCGLHPPAGAGRFDHQLPADDPAVHAVQQYGPRPAVRGKSCLDRAFQHPVLPRHRRPVAVVRAADRLHHDHRRDLGVGSDPGTRGPVHGFVPAAVGPDDRRVRRAGRPAVLLLLRSHADPDVHHHRRVRRPEPRVCVVQVLPVHVHGLAADADRDHLPVQQIERHLRHPRLAQRAADDEGTGPDLPRVPDGLRRQGADVAGAHVAAGCPRGSADRRFRRAGRDHAEAGRLRFPPFLAADRT
ncbi:hypothetical protein Lal_00014726 [Lupinus albus]|nr:hypothetical protein Lal_00014726 [Lupinus albus]